MAMLISLLLAVLAGLLAIPVTLFCAEILAAVTLPQRKRLLNPANGLRPGIAVRVPAHNESSGLQEILKNIKSQLRSDDRLLVVADNCTDDTAIVANGAGAEVTERNDPNKKGKGYALDWGLRYLKKSPPEVVIFVDADCRLENGAINELATACAASGRPLQALYLMTAPDDSPIDYRAAEFAWRVKNWVRPLGLAALNLPCQLMGTGMAFPWAVIEGADLANGQIVEDLRLGLDLARTGNPALFWPSAAVSSHFPSSAKGAETQRERWENGHLGTIVTAGPRFLCASLARRNLPLLALTLDMAVPPLTLLGIAVVLMVAVSGICFLLGVASVAFLVSTASMLCYLAAVCFSWLKYGGDILPLRAVPSIVHFVFRKLPLYRQIFSRGGETDWIRTDRNIEKDAAK